MTGGRARPGLGRRILARLAGCPYRKGDTIAASPRCRCSHPYTAHEHYRTGTDCSMTGCHCEMWRSP